MNKTIGTAILLLVSAQLAFAATETPQLKFSEVKAPQDVFSIKGSGQATVFIKDLPFNEWKAKHAGQFFPMEVAPVFTGMATGGVQLPQPKAIDASQYKEQAAEFAKAVNFRNQGGRSQLEAKPGVAPQPPQKQLADEEAGTYVVQTVLSTVIDRSISQIKITTEKFAAITENIDEDHYHFRIPGSFVIEALEQNHVAARTLNLNQAYLLSVIDFRDYECAAMKNGLRDYFSKLPEKQRLINESIYMISDLEVNNAADIAAAEKYFGKRPEIILAQKVIYADHLVRGGRTMFAFFAEGDKTRVVLLSNLALRSKFFTGKTGLMTKKLIMDGIGGTAGMIGGALTAPKDTFNDLISGATSDLLKKNSCGRGLARGLTKYSEVLFSKFADYISKN